MGTFFSGGVDSFYSLLKHRDEITHLVYVAGLDVNFHKGLQSVRTLAAAIRIVEKIAEELGIETLVVTTNLKEVVDAPSVGAQRDGNWERVYGAFDVWLLA